MVNPVPIIAVIMITLTFEGLLFGSELAERSFPSFDQPISGGFWGVLDAIIAVVQVIWGVVVFIFNLVTINVPGAPWWIRLPVAGVLGGGLIWAISELIRGK